MNPKTLATLLAAATVFSLAGCAYPPYGGSNYRAYQAGVEQSVRFGVVEAVRVVNLDAPYTGLGGATGAMLGGIAGSTVGKGSGQLAGAVAGAVIGGIIGSNVEADANKGEGLEITVLLDSGRYIAVVQAGGEGFRVGDRVRVLSGQGTTRVSH